MLPFTRETPARVWLGFVDEAQTQAASLLTSWVIPALVLVSAAVLIVTGGKRHNEPQDPPPSSAARIHVATAVASNKGASERVHAKTAPPIGQTLPPEEPEPATTVPEETPSSSKPQRLPQRLPKPLSPTAARKATRAARGLRDALSEGRARASRENFTIVALDGEETHWTDASDTCRGLQIDGVSGWRLPTRGEAREIDRGHAAPRSAYWTRQHGRHDDTIYVYDPRTHRSAPWLDQEIASVVCVQPKPRRATAR